MKFKSSISLKKILEESGAQAIGNSPKTATGINELNNAEEGDITFVDHPKYYRKALESAASFIFINKEMEAPDGKVLLVVDDPFSAYNSLAVKMQPSVFSEKPRAATSKIDPTSFIGANTFIGENVVIGKHCTILNNVSIGNHTIIGNNVIIHPGSVIGSDAFYYKDRGTHYEKMHTAGRVVIEDHVEIGANCTIDAGVSSDTVIGKGTKMDNLVQVAHDVKIGAHCLLCAHVGISGNVHIGNHVKLYGKVGVIQNVIIADGVTVLGASNVGGNLEKGKTYLGSPCEEMRVMARQWAAIKQLPDAISKIKPDHN